MIITDLKKNKLKPIAKFASKEKIAVPEDILNGMRIVIPPVYYWEDVINEVSEKMTMAFQFKGMNFGMSYPIEDQNRVKIEMMRNRLFRVVKESLDVLVHHGVQVLDSFNNIDPMKVNEQEALRFKHDKYWDKKVAAFNQLVRIMPITREQAEKLKLL